jgi:ribonuclease P protein component
LPHNRICFTFPRGFGNAVARNRAKRLGREAFRLLNSKLLNSKLSDSKLLDSKLSDNPLSCGNDLILLVYPETDMDLSGRMKQFESLFNKAGLLK